MCAAGRARGWVPGWVSGGWVGLLKRYKGGEEGASCLFRRDAAATKKRVRQDSAPAAPSFFYKSSGETRLLSDEKFARRAVRVYGDGDRTAKRSGKTCSTKRVIGHGRDRG